MWKISLIQQNQTALDIKHLDISRDDLIKHICPLLSKHIKILNKQSTQLNGSNITYHYVITDIHYLGAHNAEMYYEKQITESVEYYNKTVLSKNKLIKFSNRVASRPIEEGLLNIIDIKDYINPFNNDTNIVVESDKIIVN